MKPRNVIVTLLLLLLVLVVLLRRWQFEPGRKELLVRKGTTVSYGPSARCAMQCHNMAEDELENVLRKGIILYHQSRLRQHCPQFTIQGNGRNNQTLVMVVQQCKGNTLVLRCRPLHTTTICRCEE